MKKNLLFAVITAAVLTLTGCAKEEETKVLNMEEVYYE